MRVGSTIGGFEGGTVAVAVRIAVLGAAVAVPVEADVLVVLAIGVAELGGALSCEQATTAMVAVTHRAITNWRRRVCTIMQ